MCSNIVSYISNNFNYGEWNDDFRNNFNPPHTPTEKKSPYKAYPFPNFSSPPPRTQSPPWNSLPLIPPAYTSSPPSHLSDEFRILKISVSSSWREIKTAYSKLARIYHPDKYDNFPENNFSREKGNELFKALSNVYEKLGPLEFVLYNCIKIKSLQKL